MHPVARTRRLGPLIGPAGACGPPIAGALATHDPGMLWSRLFDLLPPTLPRTVRIEATTQIARPAPEVFAVLTDNTRLQSWCSGLTEHEDVRPLDSGVGTIFRRKYQRGGQSVEVDGEVTVFDEGACLGLRMDAPDARTNVEYTLQDIGGGRTEVTQVSSIEFHGFAATMLAPLKASKLRREAASELDALRKLAEGA